MAFLRRISTQLIGLGRYPLNNGYENAIELTHNVTEVSHITLKIYHAILVYAGTAVVRPCIDTQRLSALVHARTHAHMHARTQDPLH